MCLLRSCTLKPKHTTFKTSVSLATVLCPLHMYTKYCKIHVCMCFTFPNEKWHCKMFSTIINNRIELETTKLTEKPKKSVNILKEEAKEQSKLK